jgi:hypothetical protein
MKGKVLGFDAAAGTGVINGEDGKRYAYTAADNKSPNPTRPNDDVDFVADGANAKDIFVMMAAPVAAAPGIDLSKLAKDPNVKNILAKPYVIWAAIVIFGSLIGGYLAAISALGQIGGFYGLGVGAIFHALLFAIPVLAGVLIYFELTNHKMTQTFRLVTGAAAAGGPILLPFLAGLVSPAYQVIYSITSAVGAGTLGMIITVAGGVLILLTYFGIIKKLG